MVTGESDAFLCYSWTDKSRADQLRKALTDAGLAVFQDEFGMRDYDHITERIDAALRSTRVLVALYTPSFPTSEYCRQEMHFALLRSYRLHRSRARVLAVVQGIDIGDVRPARLKHWRLPRTDSDPTEVARSIAEFVRRLRTDDPRRLGKAPEPPATRWRAGPRRDPHELYGREIELWRIHDALFPDDDPATGGQVAAVTGIAGAGKTILAEQYARLFAADFPGGVLAPGVPATVDAAPDPGLPYLWLVEDVPDDVDRAAFDTLVAPTAQGRTLVTARRDLRDLVGRDKHIRIGGLDMRRHSPPSPVVGRRAPTTDRPDVSSGCATIGGSTVRRATSSTRSTATRSRCGWPPVWLARRILPAFGGSPRRSMIRAATC